MLEPLPHLADGAPDAASCRRLGLGFLVRFPAPPRKGHVAVHPAVVQLVRDGLGTPAHVLGDSAHRPSEFGKEPETLPVA